MFILKRDDAKLVLEKYNKKDEKMFSITAHESQVYEIALNYDLDETDLEYAVEMLIQHPTDEYYFNEKGKIINSKLYLKNLTMATH